MLAHDETVGAVRLGVTDRDGGVSASPYASMNLADHVGDEPADVAANRGTLAGRLGVDDARLVLMTQPHGSARSRRSASRRGAPLAVDALVTDRPGLRSSCSSPTARRSCSPTSIEASSASRTSGGAGSSVASYPLWSTRCER